MNAKTTRILKEGRSLFWPWCAVAISGVLPLVPRLHSLGWISVIGFFLGIPLLATLPLGNEFQYRTLSLLLSQPVARMEIWGEKLIVTVVAVLSAALVLVFPFAWGGAAPQPDPKGWALIGVGIIATTASATFWTLFARSTLGGVVLNIAVQFFIIIALNLAHSFWASGYPSPAFVIASPTVTFALLSYAGVMLWLGRRRLARFQATGGAADDDLLMSGPDSLPAALANWFRCRPTGAVLNLFRKEFRLLRPVWLITLLAAVGWSCLTLLGLLHERGSTRNFQITVVSVGVISTLMIAILAGSLSMGEERTSGTHAWHLTLPVPALLQWRIKLYMALLAGLVGAGLLPMLIAGRSLFGPSHAIDDFLGNSWLLGVVLLSFVSFWCACAVNGTVRAALWVLPVMLALGLTTEFGALAGNNLMHLFLSRFDPFADFRFTNAVVSMFTPGTLRFIFSRGFATPTLTFLLVPTCLLAVIQSYRMFRAQNQESTHPLVRNLLPLAVVAFLCVLSLTTFIAFVGKAFGRKNTVLFETVQAIAKIDRGTPNLDATHPLQLTLEDLAKASSLSEHTRRWLRDSQVTIAPLKSVPHRYFCTRFSTRGCLDPDDVHLATIRLAGGSDCTQSFQRWNPDVRTMLVVVCQ